MDPLLITLPIEILHEAMLFLNLNELVVKHGIDKTTDLFIDNYAIPKLI